MENKIIKIDNYLLVVDDSEIKEGDWVYCWETINGTPSNFDIVLMTSKNYTHWVNGADNYKKVISHLPLNNSPILEGVLLLPPLEDEVEKFLNDEINYWYHKTGSLTSEEIVRRAFSIGLKAKEKYKYTEEEMKRIYEKGYSAGRNELNSRESDKIKYDYIQSLQQPKMPVGFECEIDLSKHNGQFRTKYGIKTTINSQGLTQWIGTYKY